jgi:uncharacterized protein YecA (UPF0149 family)
MHNPAITFAPQSKWHWVPDLPSTEPAAPKMTPRNAPCPCGSGNKYKRCRGTDAARSSAAPLRP